MRGRVTQRHAGLRLAEKESGSEAGSYLRLIDYCSTQRKAQRPCRTCDESKKKKNLADAWLRSLGIQPRVG